jgi:diguanylate cyclase (GGDEF)-like protein
MDINHRLADLLGEFARTLALTELPVKEVLDGLVVRITEMLPQTSVGITLTLPESTPRYVAVSDSTALRCETLQTELGEGPRLAAGECGQAIAISDLSADTRFAQFAKRAGEEGVVSVFAFPMCYGGKQFGTLDLYRASTGLLDPREMHAAQTLADVAAAYLLSAKARSDRHASSDRERRIVSHDALTGLANRVLLVEQLERAIHERAEADLTVALLYADLDLFHSVNEMYGHEVGDEFLIAVASRLTGLLRIGDSLACLGGDAFVMLCPALQHETEAEPIAQGILAALEEPFVLATAEVRMTASIGIAFAGPRRSTPEHLLQDAGMAVQKAKDRGGDRFEIFDSSLRARAAARSDVIRELRQAVQRKEFRLYYQPVVALDGQVRGLEALVRWKHPTRGLLWPRDFITIMEETGLIVELGAWTLDQACRDMATWRKLPNRTRLTMAVNLSGRQLLESGLSAMVAATLAEHGLPATALCLEMTETVLMDDSVLVTEALNAIHELGVRLAVDDFGTGYSSLLYLRRFPVDALKLDQLFVAGLDRNAQDPAIVRAVIDLAHSLGLAAVAEGVETTAQLEALREMGCDFAQGFLWSQAVPAEDVEELLSRNALEPLMTKTWPVVAPWPSPSGSRWAPARRFHNHISVLIANSSQREIGLLYTHLEETGQFRVVADATNARSTIALAERTKPDLIVLDLTMPGTEGLQILSSLLRASPTTRVVLLADEVTDTIADEAAVAGATAVLRKGDPLPVLIEQLQALATVSAEEIAISPEAWWVLGRSTIS